MKKKYVYPKFSRIEFGFARLGGPGLGNLLFILSRAIKVASENEMELIWPTWTSIKIGPWLRREKDKRLYNDLFTNDGSYVSGLRKIALLLFGKKQRIANVEDDVRIVDESEVLCYEAFKMRFDDLVLYREEIKDRILRITRKKNLKALEHDFSHEINVHVRLGDFSQGKPGQLNQETVNTRLPIEWYVKTIKEIKEVLGDGISFNIFSDGTDEELQPILSVPGTKRVFFGNALADIIGLSQSKVLIASASSFSMWARFLGNSSCITFKHQLYEQLCTCPEGFELDYGFEESIPQWVQIRLKAAYSTDRSGGNR